MPANLRFFLLAGAIVAAAAIYAVMQRHQVLPDGGVLDRWTGNITHFIDVKAQREKAAAASKSGTIP